MDGRALDFVALGVLFFVVLTIIYGVIYIHDIPYEIAKKRNHPHQDAIHTAGWVSLFLMHTIWPFLWIWATLYKPDLGWGFAGKRSSTDGVVPVGGASKDLEELRERISQLEKQRGTFNTSISKEMQDISARVFELETKMVNSSKD